MFKFSRSGLRAEMGIFKMIQEDQMLPEMKTHCMKDLNFVRVFPLFSTLKVPDELLNSVFPNLTTIRITQGANTKPRPN